MNFYVIAVLCAVVASQVVLGAPRDDIIRQYQTRLKEQSDRYHNSATQISRDIVVIRQEVKNSTNNAISQVNLQIDNVRKAIALAKQQAAGKEKTLKCIAVQEEASKTLSSAGIDTKCGTTNFPELNEALKIFESLKNVANITITSCGKLNPLQPAQDQEFLVCVTQKAIDLEQQSIANEMFYEAAKNDVFDEHIECLSNATSPVLQKASTISFQVSFCMSISH